MTSQDVLHTPGPWTVGKKGRIMAGCMVLIGEREISARPNNIHEWAIREMRANQALIAAAPALLDAAASAAIYLQQHLDDPWTEHILKKLQLAIKDATTLPVLVADPIT